MTPDPTPLADVDILPNHPKLIRNAIKQILKGEPKLHKLNGFYNTPTSTIGRTPPYCYVMFVGRVNNKEHDDIATFQYTYNYQIGVVTNLNSPNEDDVEDQGLDMINLIESALSINKRVLDTVLLFHYPHNMDIQQFPLLPTQKHFILKVGYTQDVRLGS